MKKKVNSRSQTPEYMPPAMPKCAPPKPGTTPSPKTCNCKQRTVLSVRDFAILYRIAHEELKKMNQNAEGYVQCADSPEEMDQRRRYVEEHQRQDLYYQDLLRIRAKLGELNIEVETPTLEVEE